MQITLNGETRKIPDGTTATGLIEILELRGKRLAMEVNLEIVPRSAHAELRLNDGDRIEIVHAVGGG
ncbi:MAG: sulfur carrier protein ThiS [Gammaproteobacteria bacterium]